MIHPSRPTIITILLLVFSVSAAPQSPSEKLRDLFKREWEWTMEQSPTWASEMGDRRWNDRWPDISLDASAKRDQHRKGVVKELEAIPVDQLSPGERLNYELFRKLQQNEIAEF